MYLKLPSPRRLLADVPLKVPSAAPPWRQRLLLVLIVLAAHGLALNGSPSRFGHEPAPQASKTFITRSITPATPPEAAATPPLAKKPRPPKPASQAVLKKKEAVTPVPSSPAAVNSESTQVPEAPPEADSVAQQAPDAQALASSAVAMPSGAASSAVASAPPPAPTLPTPTPVMAMDLPGSVGLDYKMTGSSKGLTYYAKGELAWTSIGSSYEARVAVSAMFLGSRSMSSTGQVGPEGLAPTRFSDKSRSELAAHFEPEKGQISFSANTPSVPWIKGAQDRVSVFLQLTGMLAGNPAAFPVGSTITLYTVGPRNADNWTLTVEGEETLDLPFGQLPTLKLARQPRGDYDQKMEIWFAPSLLYLPVRSKISQANGDFVDQQLSGVSRP